MEAPITSERKKKAGLLALILGAMGTIAIYLWDDAIFAAPVLAFAAAKGALPAFLLFVPLYIAWSLPVSLLAVKAYNNYSEGKSPNKLIIWLEKENVDGKHKLTKRLISTGGKIGFVFSCYAIGAVLTTFFIRYSGKKEGITQVAVLASILFSITYVGFYAGLFGLIADR